MTVQAMLEAAALIVIAVVLGLAHIWNYNYHVRRKEEAEDALRLQIDPAGSGAATEIGTPHVVGRGATHPHWYVRHASAETCPHCK